MKVEFETKLRDLDLSNKAAQMMAGNPKGSENGESLPFQAGLLGRIQKLEDCIKGVADGTRSFKTTVVEDMPFKADILRRIQKLEEKSILTPQNEHLSDKVSEKSGLKATNTAMLD